MNEDQRSVAEGKAALRAPLIAARRSRSSTDRAAAAAANSAHLESALGRAATVCGYLPLPSEPLSTALFDVLAARGVVVLVPVVTTGAPLDWCVYPGPTAPGPFGIQEPTGPRWGADAVRRADAILVPALAVDPAGRRLGRGGGHYDRSLALLAPGRRTWLIGVLFDDELLEAIPVDKHDQAVTSVVTPGAGWQHRPR